MRRLLLFIRFIPAFYRLWKKWELHPDHIDLALDQYEQTLWTLTNGELSKVLYSATYIVDIVRNHFCDDCDLKGER